MSSSPNEQDALSRRTVLRRIGEGIATLVLGSTVACGTDASPAFTSPGPNPSFSAGGKAVPFDSLVERYDNGCSKWLGERTRDHTPLYRPDGGKKVWAIAYAYERDIGPLPSGVNLRHMTCRTFWCVNPEHLRVEG